MGFGVVQSLLHAGFAVRVRDIRVEAEAAAVAAGAIACPTPSQLAQQCSVVILLVVDDVQIDTVLFGQDGAAAALPWGAIVIVSSTAMGSRGCSACRTSETGMVGFASASMLVAAWYGG